MKLGVCDRSGGPLEPADLNVIKLARIEAVRIVNIPDSLPDCHCFYNAPTNGVADADLFASFVTPLYQEAYDKGARYFTIHRTPNTEKNGYRVGWNNGVEYTKWWIEVYNALSTALPDCKWGFPAMEPGENIGTVQADAEKFIKECTEAIELADFYDVKWVWKTPGEIEVGLWRIDSYTLRFRDKPMVVLFNNANSTTPKTEKAEQYLHFYNELSDRNNVIAAFAYCISSTNPLDKYLTWRGESGNLNALPRIIGRRKNGHGC